MRLLEHEAKRLLAAAGIAVPHGHVVASVAEARQAARAVERAAVIKAQVPFGGRLKAGLVAFTSGEVEAAERAAELFGREVQGYTVRELLVEERLAFETEMFIAVTYDGPARRAVMLASATGGVDVESGEVTRGSFRLSLPCPAYLGCELAARLGLRGDALVGWASSAVTAADLFRECDALLVEINPLVQAVNGRWIAADAHIELDDDALWRQQRYLTDFNLAHRGERVLTAFEARASEIDQADHRGVAGRVVEFGGDLGLLIGGGGASLTFFDAILNSGGRPANYCEIGGNPTAAKVKELTKLILGQPRVRAIAVAMNVVSNTRADVIAEGIIEGVLEVGGRPAQRILAFRVPGSCEAEATRLLAIHGVRTFDRTTSLEDVAAFVVAASQALDVR
jgi:succinyl-CoA synthetase beta subunit